MIDYSITLKNKEEGSEAQEILFSMGCVWQYNGMKKITDVANRINVYKDKTLTSGHPDPDRVERFITLQELRTLAKKEYLDENFNLVYGDGFYVIPDGSTFASGDDFGNIVFRKDGFYFEKGEWKRTATTLDNSVSLGLNIVWQRNNKCTDDNVNHPSHYTTHPSGIECIDITRHHDFAIGNAIKYLWRAGLKDSDNEVQDLKKAIWYIQDKINQLGG